MRKLIQLIVGLVLVAGSLAATLATVDMRDFELRGYVDATKERNLPFAVERNGVNVELTQYSQADLTSALEQMRAADFRWIRQFAYWDEIEPAPGRIRVGRMGPTGGGAARRSRARNGGRLDEFADLGAG